MRTLRTIALLALIVILFNWKLLLTRQYTWIDSPDNLSQVVPWLQVQARQWHGGHFPLWDPFMGAGQPLPGQVQTGTLNPLNWILFSMPFQDGQLPLWALHWYWAAIQFLGVLFAYWLCRDLRFSKTASIIGGCAYGLGGFVGDVGWPQMMMSGVLLPLVLLFFLRVLRGDRPIGNAAVSGTMLGASFLSGYHNVPIFFSLAMCGLWIYYFALLGRKGWKRAILAAAAFFCCAALLAAPQILPAVELGRLSLRWAGASHPLEWNETLTYNVHDEHSVFPAALLGIVIPGFNQSIAVFSGLVILTLALLGLIAGWQERSTRVLGAISLGGLLFSLGARDLFHGILYATVPMVEKARSPWMAIVIFQLGLVALAARGFDLLRSSAAAEHRARIATRTLLAAGLLAYAALVAMISVRPAQGQEYLVLGEAAIVALLLAAIIHAFHHDRLSRRSAGVLIILLLLFELNNVTNAGYAFVETAAGPQKLTQDRDLAGFLRLMRPPVRVEVDEREFPYNFGDWFSIPTLNGNHPGEIKGFVMSATNPNSLPLLAANYYLGKEPKRPGQQALFEGQRGVKVFSNPGTLPFARMVYRAVSLPTETQVLWADQDPKYDLASTVILAGETPPLDGCRETGTVDVARYRTSSVVLKTNSMCRGMVILADVWFPGWKATVDGKPAKIWNAYGGLRGVMVDGGQHEVLMAYRPMSVFGGAALGALGILLCIVLYRGMPRRWRGIHLRPHHPAQPPAPPHSSPPQTPPAPPQQS